jgi:hypothetical protein
LSHVIESSSTKVPSIKLHPLWVIVVALNLLQLLRQQHLCPLQLVCPSVLYGLIGYIPPISCRIIASILVQWECAAIHSLSAPSVPSSRTATCWQLAQPFHSSPQPILLQVTILVS